jgi:hypothetical protein
MRPNDAKMQIPKASSRRFTRLQAFGKTSKPGKKPAIPFELAVAQPRLPKKRDPRRATQQLMPLEILHVPLVLFRRGARFEGAEIAALAGFRIHFSGIEPIFARSQFSDHGTKPSCSVFLALIAKPPLTFPWGPWTAR